MVAVETVRRRRLGAVIRLLRTAYGLSQADLAEAMGVSRAYVAQIESERIGNPGWLEMLRCAARFGLSVEQLCTVADEYELRIASFLSAATNGKG